MSKNGCQKLWRYTELSECPSNDKDDIEITKTDDKKLSVKNIAQSSLQIEDQETAKPVSLKVTPKTPCPKAQEQKVILLKNIRLLKVHVYKPKTEQCGNRIHEELVKKGTTSIVNVTPENVSCIVPSSKLENPHYDHDKLSVLKPKMEANFVGPSKRWPSQPRKYRGAKKIVQMPLLCTDTTDGETSGMGSSVDDVFESSTESEATASLPPPKTNGCRSFPPPAKKRRGGWPKGRKRNPNTALTKNTYPKSPTTAYGFFLVERHKLYQNIEPNIPIAFLSKILGAEWKHLLEDEKAVYITLSEQDKQRYRNELKCYRHSRDNLVLRKKRAKTSSMKEEKSTGEESTDGTDEVDDEESRDLYCKTCDQWFTSLHNKTEHLYGRYHLNALNEGQPKVRKSRWKSTTKKSVTFAGTEESPSGSSPLLVKSESEDDVSMSTGDEQASKSDCQSYRESTTEDEDEIEPYPERVSDCLQVVVSKVYDREKELNWLAEHLESGKKHQQFLISTLSSLEKRHKELQKEQEICTSTERILTRELHSLWKLPLAVDNSQYSNPFGSTLDLLEKQELENEAATDETKQGTSGGVLISNLQTDNLLNFCSSDINNLDLDHFSSSILGEDIDFNLFASEFFIDFNQENEENGT